MTYLNLSVLEYIAQVLGDTVFRTKVLFGEVNSFLVRKDGSWVRSEEFLLDAHIVISNGKYSSSILGRFCWKVFLILLESCRVQSLRQHHLLKQDHCTHCVVQGQLMLVQL